MLNIVQLPDAMFALIWAYLEPANLPVCNRVSKLFYRLSQEEKTRRETLYKLDFQHLYWNIKASKLSSKFDNLTQEFALNEKGIEQLSGNLAKKSGVRNQITYWIQNFLFKNKLNFDHKNQLKEGIAELIEQNNFIKIRKKAVEEGLQKIKEKQINRESEIKQEEEQETRQYMENSFYNLVSGKEAYLQLPEIPLKPNQRTLIERIDPQELTHIAMRASLVIQDKEVKLICLKTELNEKEIRIMLISLMGLFMYQGDIVYNVELNISYNMRSELLDIDKLDTLKASIQENLKSSKPALL